MSNNTFACLDIGGTAIKYGLLEADGTVLEKYETPTEAAQGGPALADKVSAIVQKLQEADPQISGIAISTAGVVDFERCEIVHASDAIPGYIGINYKERLKEFGLPVEAENDVNSAGLAEASGAAEGAKSAVIVTIGTGIGACFLQEGQVLHGNSFSACEVGYLPMYGSTWQELASTTALVENVAARKEEPVSEWNGRKIFDLAEQGDAICQEEIAKTARLIGEGLGMLSLILNPEVFVLGGGIMARGESMRPLIEEAFRQATIPLVGRTTRLAFAKNENDAGMKGALENFLQKHPDLK